MPRDKKNALMVTTIVFYLMFNIIAPVATLTPFRTGIILSEVAIIPLFAWTLPGNILTKIVSGVFVQYAATCCFLIGCKFYFERFGSFLAVEIALFAHAISLVGFILFFLFNSLAFAENNSANRKLNTGTNFDASVDKHQFSLEAMLFWITAIALLFVLFKASWPVERGDFSGELAEFSITIAPILIFAPLTTAGILWQHSISRWGARILLLFALPASIGLQSYLLYTRDYWTSLTVISTLMLDLGFLTSLVAVCLLLRAVEPAHNQTINH
jgi:hypothetical protein